MTSPRRLRLLGRVGCCIGLLLAGPGTAQPSFTDAGAEDWALGEQLLANLTNHPARDGGFPAWSPDGWHIAFVSDRDGNFEIYMMAATLVEGPRQAGAYTVHWDGRDAQGRNLASGVYLYRLQTDQGQVETRKLVLLR